MENTIYTCPMHPEITSGEPGRCPKCSMDLVPKKKSSKIALIAKNEGLGMLTWKSYAPLFAVIGVILLSAVALSLRDAQAGVFSGGKAIAYFMTGFFLTFATFKLIDLKGFKEGYSTYDLLAQKMPAYGYVYPFIELFFGLAMILLPHSTPLLIAEIAVMLFSGIGVAIKLARKEPFICACLGTFLKVPLTKITLIEDFGMAGLALILLILK